MVDGLAFDDLDLFGGELDDPAAELEQDIVHTLEEVFGSNVDDPARGIGLSARLSSVFDPRLASQAESQLERDDRIDAARVTITAIADGEYQIDVEVQPNALVLNLIFDPTTGAMRRST